MNGFRTTIAILAVFLAIGCAADGPAGPSDGHTLRGVVVAADTEAPVAGATVSIEPGARRVTTGADGRFAFDFDAPRASTLTLTVEKSGYSRVRVDVPPSSPSTLNIALPPFDRIEAPSHGFRVWAEVVDGGLDHPTITWRVEVENREATILGPISVEGRLDFQARLTEESFELREPAPGEIELEIGADGRSFTARLDALAPSSGLVEVLRFTVASPGPDRTICYFVEGEADADGATLRYEDSSCLTTPIGG